MNGNDAKKLTEVWFEETNTLNRKVDESFKHAQNHAYDLGYARAIGIAGILEQAIVKTLNENGHLADGDVCTLIDIKKALEDIGKPWQLPSDV